MVYQGLEGKGSKEFGHSGGREGDSVCLLQVNTSAAIFAVTGVYMAALITGLDERKSVNLAANELGCASASALLI